MRLDDIASPEYRKVLRDTHASQKGWGGGGKYWDGVVLDFIRELGGAQSVLDYGCGQGVLKKKLGVDFLDVREYDPGIAGKDVLPSPADVVVCTDVLEHVEPDKVQMTCQFLRQLTQKGLFAVIATTPANLILTDGRNAHLTVRPGEWWLHQLQAAHFEIMRYTNAKALHVWARPDLARGGIISGKISGKGEVV